MQNIGKIVVAAVAALSLAACGQQAKTQSAAPAGPSVPSSSAAPAPQSKGRECTADDVKTTGKFGEVPTITIPDDCDPPKKLITKDLSDGTGDPAKTGQKLQMNYLLVTWSDKQKLDSSFDRGKPFDLNLGAGEVIPGWDQGLAGIKQGARRLLIIPPDLAYGEGGNGMKPNETLVFVTDAVAVGAA
ncbi:peptidylprolyl isomerase [Amycolatopsis mediterranei S699]|uniref:Peptidyl-prolyl cis-trans isomerase n=2 Tax=Amycolatopsis mediterranei TaxID=33910 RepID=A0A0H3D315_AMYMU|nr:FKBP-type peptidyl-prolyl cis-trans isomerase [Amycolatopsis mediterranei]ADJ44612.1 peptidylprolyl isomerase [Amycolatopsis mediterranei U32]AEK41351.1 peptidylprolyl isomerase [Amycolatopsis mediterranei S699]AFO76325.1 peptidylprolyl isomerase [Amycolatopsis mediterranei S699]AGT83454.1 peptidylprolyl isomerase [Amycolatopsis mediterranei RB]KDO07030.1 peptidylprolyl isomerase [Amycolatopsis mediterranei]